MECHQIDFSHFDVKTTINFDKNITSCFSINANTRLLLNH